MGKWSTQHTEDVLLAKIRMLVTDAIEAHSTEKRIEGEARPVTFTEFVEQLDVKDKFTTSLMEILVKEFSERKERKSPVERQLLFASKTCLSLDSLIRNATIYDDSRQEINPGRTRSASRLTSLLRQQIGEDDPTLDFRPDSPTNESDNYEGTDLDDAEFVPHWNSLLYDSYVDDTLNSTARMRRRNQSTTRVDDPGTENALPSNEGITVGDVVTGLSDESSPIESDTEVRTRGPFASSRLRPHPLLNMPQSRSGTSQPRASLLRRYPWTTTRGGGVRSALESNASMRRRLTRGLQGEPRPASPFDDSGLPMASSNADDIYLNHISSIFNTGEMDAVIRRHAASSDSMLGPRNGPLPPLRTRMPLRARRGGERALVSNSLERRDGGYIEYNLTHGTYPSLLGDSGSGAIRSTVHGSNSPVGSNFRVERRPQTYDILSTYMSDWPSSNGTSVRYATSSSANASDPLAGPSSSATGRVRWSEDIGRLSMPTPPLETPDFGPLVQDSDSPPFTFGAAPPGDDTGNGNQS